MYAVEEYGKAILLKRTITGNKKKYQIEQWILGIGDPNDTTISHDEKMRIAFDNLPNDCRIKFRGIKITQHLSSGKSITIKKGKQGPYDQVYVPEGLTGTFTNTTNTNANTNTNIFDYNLDLKTACFYMDWDRDNWKFDAAIAPEELNKNITCFEGALGNGIKCNKEAKN